MGIRTSSQAVRAAIQTELDINVDAFIRTGSAVTDQIVANDSQSLLSEALLFEIETYLAAHFYALFDPQYTEKETGDAQAKFQGQFGKRFDSTSWGQMAISLDQTGFLSSMNRGKTSVGITWLGKQLSEQIAYGNRD